MWEVIKMECKEDQYGECVSTFSTREEAEDDAQQRTSDETTSIGGRGPHYEVQPA